MFIKELKLNNYRNYSSELFFFEKGLNIVCGDNAQGKTNLAESIFYLSTGYSQRAKNDKEVIFFGEEKASVEGRIESNFSDTDLKIVFNKKSPKEYYINGIKTNKAGEFLGTLKAIYFSPENLKLVKEMPEHRRRFMDISLSQMSKDYFYSLSRYNKILMQRNSLLKEEDSEVIYETLPIWDKQLAKEGANIIFKRIDFIKRLAPIAKAQHLKLTESEELEISYDSKFWGSEKEIEESFYGALLESVEKDISLGYTTLGPQRDDLKILIDKKDVKIFASQGQQRSAALSIKLAETEIFKEDFKEYPVLILDDVLSELDEKRQGKLLEIVKKMQTVLTTATIKDIAFDGIEFNKIEIKSGKKITEI